MSHEEFIRNQREMYYDRKHDAALQGVIESAAAGETGMGAGGGGGLGGLDLGGGEELGAVGAAPDIGGDDAAAGGGPDAGAADAGGESPLLAAPPGSRNAPRLTPGAKGKVYYPKKRDDRPAGGRSRAYASVGKTETSARTTFPGYSDGLKALANGVYTEDVSSYSINESKEEQALFERSDTVVSLIESLDEAKEKELLTESEKVS